MDAELRREAAGEIKGQIVELLRSVERAVVAAASGDTLGLLEEREADNFLGRLTWLLGLSEQERAFVNAAGEAAAKADPTKRLEEFSVFADWLDDQWRARHAERLRELVTQEQAKLGEVSRTDAAALQALLSLLANMTEGQREGNVFQKAAGAVDRLRRENEALRTRAERSELDVMNLQRHLQELRRELAGSWRVY